MGILPYLLVFCVWAIGGAVGVETDGGWHLARGNADDELLIARCDIDRVGAITPEEFGKKYYKQKPVILTGIVQEWPAYKKWTKDYIRTKYGRSKVHITTSEGVHRHYGIDGDAEATIADFFDGKVDITVNHTVKHSGEPIYVFDNSRFVRENPDVLTEAPQPDLFPFGKDPLIYFMMGEHGSGVAAHWHTETVNGLVYGMKRWFLKSTYNMDTSRTHDHEGIRHWLQHKYPKLKEADRPLECIQRRGDLMYIPEHWSHATINIGETIGMSWQLQILDYGLNMAVGAKHYKRNDIARDMYLNYLGTPQGGKRADIWRELAAVTIDDDPVTGLKYYKKALRLDHDHENPVQWAQSHMEYAGALVRTGKVDSALPYYYKAFSILDDAGLADNAAAARKEAARQLKAGDAQDALTDMVSDPRFAKDMSIADLTKFLEDVGVNLHDEL